MLRSGMDALRETQGPDGTLAQFLRDLGPALLEKYKPRAIVVFSAHWETSNEQLVTDYGANQPLLMDCAFKGVMLGGTLTLFLSEQTLDSQTSSTRFNLSLMATTP